MKLKYTYEVPAKLVTMSKTLAVYNMAVITSIIPTKSSVKMNIHVKVEHKH